MTILNIKQYEITVKQRDKFRREIEEFDFGVRVAQGIPRKLVKAELEALQSVCDELEREIEEYLEK